MSRKGKENRGEEERKVEYYKQRTDAKGQVYSVDNVRISFHLDEMYFPQVRAMMNDSRRIDITAYPETYKTFQYRYMFTITYGNAETATVGICWNGIKDAKEDKYSGFLDFNPNKVGKYEQFWNDFHAIKACATPHGWEIKRIDLAVDVAVDRASVFLKKDQRKYTVEAYSLSNRTEYLGKRNEVGRVKVYNKAEEQKLQTPMTRIETTIEPTEKSFMQHAPKVCAFGYADGQLDIEYLEAFSALNPTERYIVDIARMSITQGDDYGFMRYQTLGRKMKEKLGRFIIPESSVVSFDEQSIRGLLLEYMQIIA